MTGSTAIRPSWRRARRASRGRWRCRRSSTHRGSSRCFRSSGRSGSRCTSTICGCRGSAGRSSASANYVEALADRRFWSALGAHGASSRRQRSRSSSLLGLVLALALNRVARGPRAACALRVLLPWAIPTVVVGAGLALHVREPGRPRQRRAAHGLGLTAPTWFADRVAAWVPLILADVWKTTPFVALLLLAGLQNIDRSLYEAARRRRRGRLAAVRRRSRCRCSRPALLVAVPVPHARRVSCLRPGLRDDRRRTGHRHRADRALHVHARCCRTCASATARRCR